MIGGSVPFRRQMHKAIAPRGVRLPVRLGAGKFRWRASAYALLLAIMAASLVSHPRVSYLRVVRVEAPVSLALRDFFWSDRDEIMAPCANQAGMMTTRRLFRVDVSRWPKVQTSLDRVAKGQPDSRPSARSSTIGLKDSLLEGDSESTDLGVANDGTSFWISGNAGVSEPVRIHAVASTGGLQKCLRIADFPVTGTVLTGAVSPDGRLIAWLVVLDNSHYSVKWLAPWLLSGERLTRRVVGPPCTLSVFVSNTDGSRMRCLGASDESLGLLAMYPTGDLGQVLSRVRWSEASDKFAYIIGVGDSNSTPAVYIWRTD